MQRGDNLGMHMVSQTKNLGMYKKHSSENWIIRLLTKTEDKIKNEKKKIAERNEERTFPTSISD